MGNERWIDGSEVLYVRISNFLSKSGDTETVTLYLPKSLAGRYLRIEVLPENASDTPARNHCSARECRNCGVVSCEVHYGNADLMDIGLPKHRDPEKIPIPGHSHCFYGDCDDCNDVTCLIHEGWEKLPPLPDED